MTISQNYQSEFRNAIKAAIRPWIEWTHVSKGFTHCPTCLRLDKCWFVADNMPQLPQHPGCHCTAEKISNAQVKKNASATSPYGKFDPFLFNTSGAYHHGKEVLFGLWGYGTDDIPWLIKEFNRQALEKYIAGDYTLHKLDKDGQRINIIIQLPKRTKAVDAFFTTGWMVEPKGELRLATPYGDK